MSLFHRNKLFPWKWNETPLNETPFRKKYFPLPLPGTHHLFPRDKPWNRSGSLPLFPAIISSEACSSKDSSSVPMNSCSPSLSSSPTGSTQRSTKRSACALISSRGNALKQIGQVPFPLGGRNSYSISWRACLLAIEEPSLSFASEVAVIVSEMYDGPGSLLWSDSSSRNYTTKSTTWKKVFQVRLYIC